MSTTGNASPALRRSTGHTAAAQHRAHRCGAAQGTPLRRSTGHTAAAQHRAHRCGAAQGTPLRRSTGHT
ncbi:hypothetical protein, partial [Rhodococcus rhodochrous]|uniref:hypothetical protein n=1 Tax=Rhodococcus rhodochrous TaxID=1829 RepID=UPI001EE6D271